MDPLEVIEEIMEDELNEPDLRLAAARTLAEYKHRKLKAAEETDIKTVPEININISKKASPGQRVKVDSDRVAPVIH